MPSTSLYLAQASTAIFGTLLGQRQRFFTENVLPCGNGTLDLLGVKRMRRGKDDGLHTGVLEGFRFAADSA